MVMENILETGILTQDEILNLELKQFKNTAYYSKLQNMKGKVKKHQKEPIQGEEGIDYCTCPVCKIRIEGSLKKHVNSWHPIFNWEKFREENVNFIVYCKSMKDKTITSGDTHWTKRTEAKEKLSNNMKGSKNPMHRDKTTNIERREISPKCIEFYEKRFPNLTDIERRNLLKNQIEKTQRNTPKESRPQNKEYWINKGFSEEESIIKAKDRQSVGKLENFIKRYGEEEGRDRWLNRQKKWKKTIKEKYGVIGRSVSLVSLTIFEYLKKKFPDREFQFGEMNEKYISNEKSENTYSYDFTDSINKKIIEFNGDYWHMNPKIYKPLDFNKSKKKTAKEMWDYDKHKIDTAKSNGYEVLVIWENDYTNSKEEVLEKCIKFLSEKND